MTQFFSAALGVELEATNPDPLALANFCTPIRSFPTPSGSGSPLDGERAAALDLQLAALEADRRRAWLEICEWANRADKAGEHE